MDNTQTNYVTEMERREAAMLMLTSSTHERFYNVVTEIAEKSEVNADLKKGEVSVDDLFTRARHLWRELTEATQRDLPEVELAVLLAILAPYSDPCLNSLLAEVSRSTNPATAWLRELSLRLLQNQPLWVRVNSLAAKRRVQFVVEQQRVENVESVPDVGGLKSYDLNVQRAANDYSYSMAA